MIPFHANDSRTSQMIGLVAGAEAMGFRTWSEFESHAAASDVAVVAIEGPDVLDECARLEWLMARHGTRIVLVLGDNVREEALLGRTRVSSVIRLPEIQRMLPAGVETAREEGWRQGVVSAFARATPVPMVIRMAVRSACRDDPQAARSVKAVARNIGTHPATIGRQWHTFHSHRTDFQAFLGWVRLDWALRHRWRSRNWVEVGRQLGTNERTLRRLAAQLTNSPLRDLALQGRRELHRLFDTAVMIPLLGNGLGE